MAVIRNITGDRRHLFTISSPPIEPGDKASLSDARLVGLVVPRDTWEIIEPPAGCIDVGPADGYLFLPAPQEEEVPTAPADSEE